MAATDYQRMERVDSDSSVCGIDEPVAARDRIADAIANGIEPTVVPDDRLEIV